jgi:DNA-binding PadR family transcriptional regulator
VQHVEPVPGKTRYEGQVGGGEVILAYRITEKGRTVLGLIQSDVEAFLARQKSYQEAKRNGQRRRA